MRAITAGTMTIAILAILVGLVGAYTIRTMLVPDPPPPAPRAPAPVLVPLASADLPPGRAVAQGDIALVSMSRENLRKSGFPLEVTMLTPQQIIGRRLREPIQQGKPFLTTSFYLEGSLPSISESLKPGYRAVTLPLSKEDQGIVTQGTHVDIMFLTHPNQYTPEMTVTLVELAEVLWADKGRATMAVTYEDARKLETVEGRGYFRFVPRPPGDQLVGVGDPLTFHEVLGIQPPPLPPPPIYTEVYRGGRRSYNQFGAWQAPAAQPVEEEDELFPYTPPPSIRGRSQTIDDGQGAGADGGRRSPDRQEEFIDDSLGDR